MDIGELSRDLSPHVERLRAARASVADPPRWYLYETLANVGHLDALLEDPYRDLGRLADGRPVADIGAADGDLAFTLEAVAGWDVDIVDTAKANMNGLEGARRSRRRCTPTSASTTSTSTRSSRCRATPTGSSSSSGSSTTCRTRSTCCNSSPKRPSTAS